MMCLGSCGRTWAALALGLPLLAGAPGHAETAADARDVGTVQAVIDGDTLRLDDGRTVRLVGIEAPKPPLGRRDGRPWPIAERARAELSRLTLGKKVILDYGGAREDRYGRRLAQVYRDDGPRDGSGAPGPWLQGEMLRRGLARVHTQADNRALAAQMLAAERGARAARRGLWALDVYRIRRPEELGADADSFQLVEGTVQAAAVTAGRGYLNFGPDRHTDFTVVVPAATRRQLREAGIDFAALAGRRVLVRGWIMLRDGPMIELSHAEAIELTEE
ncbi:MAG TPA: thermonuclease family protein [Alphaproteobacteria bacterium]|jgi:endonuclease YncB( thermonuclease family)|nr:thermonuclease family protein [Alphaproteobacteria bacterium]